MNWSRLMNIERTDNQSMRAEDSASSVLVPRAVLGERFYRPRSRHKQGRRQEPCSTPNHLPTRSKLPSLSWRRPPSVRDLERYTAKVVLRLLETTLSNFSHPHSDRLSDL